MAGEYIILSKAQAEWMRKAIKKMIQLTAYYSLKRQPLKDADYENIFGAFSNYTEKSRGNKMIIQCSVAFAGYLNELEKTSGCQKRMNQKQMQMLADVIDELFDMTEIKNGMMADDVHQKLSLCGTELQEYMLLADMKDIFKEYISFCTERCAELTTEKIKEKCFGVSTQQMRGR